MSTVKSYFRTLSIRPNHAPSSLSMYEKVVRLCASVSISETSQSAASSALELMLQAQVSVGIVRVFMLTIDSGSSPQESNRVCCVAVVVVIVKVDGTYAPEREGKIG